MFFSSLGKRLDNLVGDLQGLPTTLRHLDQRLRDRPTHADIVLVKEEIGQRLDQFERRLDVMMEVVRKDYLR